MNKVYLALFALLTQSNSLSAAEHSNERLNPSVSNELATLSNSGSTSLNEMIQLYGDRLNTFVTLANDHHVDVNEKKARMNAWLSYAEREVTHQTNGSGITYTLLSEYIRSVKTEINRGNFSAASGSAISTAQWLLNVLE